jgi:cytochrome oxidase Cu insertion factor (SCO1/SenC/PrrC family)
MARVSAVGAEGYSGRVRALVLIAALFALVAAGCGSESGDQAAPTTTETARSKGGPMAPAIEGTTLDGERLSLADFRGRPVLVNVWAAW